MKILFSGIGGPTPLGLARSVKAVWPNYECIGVDASPWAPSLYQSDVYNRTYRVPNANDSNYWEEIEELVKEEGIDFAFIVPETEILIWAKRALTHALPCPIHAPHYELSNFCFDKSKVADLLYKTHLTPKTIIINTKTVLNEDHVGLDYPYWIRIKSGAGALGALKIDSKKDLQTWLSLHANRNDFMASEYLPGRNYACKLLYKNGELIQSASAERIDYLLSAAAPSGISGMCSRGKLLNRNDLVEKSMDALESIASQLNVPLHGMFTVDFKEDKEGQPLITEINIRHVSFNEAFALGGINLAETTLRMYFDDNFQKPSKLSTFESENYFIRGVDAPLRLVSANELKSIGKI